MSDPRPEPTKWQLLIYPATLFIVPALMLCAVSARDDLEQPLPAIIVGIAIFGLAGGVWLSWLWWKRFGRA